jgi:hypothetical protein
LPFMDAANGRDKRPKLAPVQILDVRSKRMAANAKQGTYLSTTLIGFTSFVAGLHSGGGLGIVFAIVGAGLLFASAAGFYKIKTV